MSRTLTWTVIGAMLLLSLSIQESAAVVYVNQNAPGGTNNGSSWGTAFLKIQDAVDAAQPGDEVWVARGTYNESLRVATMLALYGGFSGTETDMAQRNVKANVTTLAWDATTPAVDGIGANLVVSGFRIRSPYLAIDANVSGTSLTVTDCDIGGGGTGIRVTGSEARIAGNRIEGGNTGVFALVTHLILTGNSISGTGWGVQAGPPIGGSASTLSLAGNTITGNNYGLLLGTGRGKVANNIIAFNSNTGIDAQDVTGLYFSCNNVYGNTRANYSQMPDVTGRNGNISADPLLSSVYHDIHIQPDSPCRNAGNDAFAITALDLDGQPRIQDDAVDIGADESDGASQSVPSHIWYVRATGNDADEGSSWATAKATVTAVLRVARGGDEVWVANGTYSEPPVTLGVPAGVALYGGFTGSESSRAQRNVVVNPAVIERDGTRAVIFAPYAGSRVDGFTLRGGTQGVWVSGYTVIANCTIISNSEGVRVELGSATLNDNFIADNRTDAVILYKGVADMRGNLVDWNAENGIHAQQGSYLTLTRNIIQRNNHNGLFLEGDAWADVHSNVILANTLAAVWLDPGSRMNLHNNTIARSDSGGSGVFIHNATAHLTNNIIAFHTFYGIWMVGDASVVTLNGNDLFANSPNYQDVPADLQQNNVSADPQFVDYTNWNFRLLSGSPMIDAGVDSVVIAGDLDLDGRPRILGTHVDIGAYEYTAPGLVTMEDVLAALRVHAGILAVTPAELPRWNVVEPSTKFIDLMDAVRLARKVAGLEANP